MEIYELLVKGSFARKFAKKQKNLRESVESRVN